MNNLHISIPQVAYFFQPVILAAQYCASNKMRASPVIPEASEIQQG